MKTKLKLRKAESRNILYFLTFCFLFSTFVSSAGATWTNFDGLSTRLHITDTDFDITIFTVCLHSNKEGAGENLLGRYAEKGGTNGWLLQHDTANVRFRVEWNTTLADWDIVDQTQAHICVAYDGTSAANDPAMYVDGSLMAFDSDLNGTGTWTPDTSPQNIGNDSGGTRTFDGQLGDFTFYNEKFASASETLAVMHYGWMARPKGIKAYIPMGSFAGRDYSGNGNNFTEAGTIATTNTGPHRSSVQASFIWLGM